MWKRLIGILVVLVMALSLPIAVMAETPTTDPNEEEENESGSTLPEWTPPPGWTPPPEDWDWQEFQQNRDLGCDHGHADHADFFSGADVGGDNGQGGGSATTGDGTPLDVPQTWNNVPRPQDGFSWEAIDGGSWGVDEDGNDVWIESTIFSQGLRDFLRGLQGNPDTSYCEFVEGSGFAWQEDFVQWGWTSTGGVQADPFISALGMIGEFTPGANHTGGGWISFNMGFIHPDDVVTIAQYLHGNGWLIIENVVFYDGMFWFEVEDFGLWSLFFALIARGMPVEEAWENANEAAVVLGAVSPDTSDSSLGMFAMIAIMLAALGIAGFAIARARKEMV